MTTSFCKTGEWLNIPETGFDPVTSELWAPRSSFKLPRLYRQPVSIEWPRSYEPRALPLRHAGYKYCPSALMHRCDVMIWIPATRFDRVTSELWAPRASRCAMPVFLTSLLTTSFCKAVKEFIYPNNFDLVMSGLFELKIHIDRRRIRTSDNTLCLCLVLWITYYHSAMRRFCNHCLEWMYPNLYIKT